MRISRPCYDKFHRCPGWAGGGLRYARVSRCDGGYLGGHYEKRFWAFRVARCPKCGVYVLPYHVRKLDWRWLAWHIPFKWGNWWQDIRHDWQEISCEEFLLERRRDFRLWWFSYWSGWRAQVFPPARERKQR